MGGRREKAGYYQLGFRYKQDQVVNGESLRWLRIDGKTPFSEAESIRFPYGASWQFLRYSDEQGEPYLVWLDAGKHELSLGVTLGEYAEVYRRLSGIVKQLGDEYMKIVMITGDTPDVNRDYDLFKQIPDFNGTLQNLLRSLTQLTSDMQKLTGKRGSEYTAAMKNMARVLGAMLKSPYSAQAYVQDYYTNYCTVSSWLYEMKSMPLALDEIELVPEGREFTGMKASFAQSVVFGAQEFFGSFTRDYQSVSVAKKGRKSITLWVNWGRDQAMVLNALIHDSFTASTGVNVNLKLVNASLVNGILAGNYPDVALQLSRAEPVNLGMRGALYDLSKFGDFASVLSRFQTGAEVPYRYNDGCYALPDTQTFFSMFCRTDILQNMRLEVPKTWDEFLHVATIIQRSNLQVYIPYTQITASNTVDSGIGSLNLYPTLMLQNGLSLYNADHTATTIDTPAAISVFDTWTRLYTDYTFVKEADFYNRFRVGTMPLGIAPYTLYMTLKQTAPEIQGRWTIVPVPGTVGGNNFVSGGGTGCVIIAKSKTIQEDWEFLKWWTSADTQTRYSNNVESVLGLVGRQPTSNVQAFRNMAWDAGDCELLTQQWGNVREIPEIPGSYYLTRAVDQAYWSVINGEANSTDAVIKWSKVADAEITRKIQQYGGGRTK